MPFVLKTACTRGKLDLETARQILDALGNLPIEVDASPAPGQRQLFELTIRHKLGSYDAAYVELAMRHGEGAAWTLVKGSSAVLLND